MLKVLPNYPGSKGGSGVAKRIVSMMPPHRVYVEAFLGSGAVLRLKRPAALNVGMDLDPLVINAWSRSAATLGVMVLASTSTNGETLLPISAREASAALRMAAARAKNGEPVRKGAPGGAAGGTDAAGKPRGTTLVMMVDALELLCTPPPVLRDPRTLIYCDPPYLTSQCNRNYYAKPMGGELDHVRFLAAVRALPSLVMVSHYPCPLYDDYLSDWRAISFTAMTHGGPRTECVWCNFAEPATFHDARFLGSGFRERERIKKKSNRWRAKFMAMPAAERQLIASALASVDLGTLEAAIRDGAADMVSPPNGNTNTTTA